MVDILGLVSKVVTPFFEHPVLLFFFILLVVGADASNAFSNANTPIQIKEGQHYEIGYRMGWFGGVDLSAPFCYAKYPSEPTLSNDHLPSTSELLTLCKTHSDLGVFGGLFSEIINQAGEFSNIEALKDAEVSSWMLFALMLFTTFLVWAVTASTRS